MNFIACQQQIRNLMLCCTSLVTVSCATVPNIVDFEPKLGPVGTEVMITGANLAAGTPAESEVSIHSVNQPLNSVDAASLRFNIAVGTRTGPVRVSTSAGSDTSAYPFVVVREPDDSDPGFVFEGDDGLRGEGVSTSEIDQKVLVVAVEPRWLNTGAAFTDVEAQIASHGTNMSDFWEEDSYGAVSFDVDLLGDDIINLGKSYQYYYHGSRPRKLLSRTLPATTTLADAKTLTVISDGQDIEVSIDTGDYTVTGLSDAIQAAIDDADSAEPPPTFTVSAAGSKLSFNTTIPANRASVLELEGDAIPHIGFGSESLLNLGDDSPIILLFGAPVAKENINFPSAASLTIATQGTSSTTASFAADETLDLAEIVDRINAAYAGDVAQQPFNIAIIDDPLDSDQGFLTISTVIDSLEDDGFMLQVSGAAGDQLGLSAIGLNRMGQLERFEPEMFRGHEAILDGFNLYAASLPGGTSMESIFGDARIFVGSIIDPSDNFRASASGWSFNIQGEIFEVSYFTDSWQGSWQVFAHETGHTLTMPDLYRTRDELLGDPPGNWDIMHCSGCDAHTTSYLRSFRFHRDDTRPAPWVDPSAILQLTPPSGSLSRTDRYILTPLESPWSSESVNPFATSHPGVPVVQSVEFIPSDDSDIFVTENRQKGVYRADHLGDPVDYSTSLPDAGVIFYQGRRTAPESAGSFLPVNLLTPMSNALNSVGESFRRTITLLNGIDLQIIEVLANPDSMGGPNSSSYLVESVWGEGSFFDVSINKWSPPPWETSDIWVDNRAENNWDVYTYAADEDGLVPELNGDNVAVGEVNRVYARIRNSGDVAIPDDIELVFKVAVPLRVGEASESVIETEIGRTIVTGGLDGRGGPNAEKRAYIEWTPRDTNQEHVCIKVYVTPVSGELNATENNNAQENLTQWFSEAASPFAPVSFSIITENPFPERTSQIRLRVPKVPLGWTVQVEDVEFVLNPGEVYKQHVTVTPEYERLLPQINEQGYANSFAANIQALTPVGDNWTIFGGITSVIHPVNASSSIVITPSLPPGGSTALTQGLLVSDGPMVPSLGGRVVNLRYRPTIGDEIWLRVRTTPAGRFAAQVPTELLGSRYTVKAFHSGARGIGPLRSQEVTVGEESDPGPVVPGGGSVVRY